MQHIPPLLNSPQFRAAMTADLDDPEGLSGFCQWYDEMTPALRSQARCCIAGSVGTLMPCPSRSQIACASSVNAAATRSGRGVPVAIS